ncbi:MAG: MotA/TolQ/ExbB proton channel family protein [Gammaproteobacteria bacterium]|nr:MotA/TolQ/ExbB proton channel family protein [Gammaproteobacteria bacterium]
MVELAALALSIALAAQQPATGAVPAQQDAAAATSLPASTADTGSQSEPGIEVPAIPERTAGLEKVEEKDNPYGLSQLWVQGDFVARGTLIILVVMSFVSWFIILTKLWDQSRLRRQFNQVDSNFWSGKSLQDGVATISDPENSFRIIAEQGLKAAKHHEGRLTDQIPLHEWITASLQRAVDKVINDLQSGLSFLATAGSTAPFIGLFGTVWGIYHALIAIGVAGQASIDKVAGPVGEALIMTALGLAVAVPAVLGYNWLLRRNKALLEEVRYFATEIQQYLVSGARLESPGQRSK